jgi:hypothetical protein
MSESIWTMTASISVISASIPTIGASSEGRPFTVWPGFPDSWKELKILLKRAGVQRFR